MREKGFTLIELMIVVAIIAIIAAIAIPNLMRARLAANESSAISGLRTVSSAQETFRSSTVKDQDTDGLGEYGTLLELAGLTTPAGGTAPADPPFIDNQLGQGNKSGYSFAAFVGGNGLGCAATGITPATNASEITYYATAWPISHGRSGNRTFAIDASGVIRSSDIGGTQLPSCAAITSPTSPWPVVGG